MEGTVLIKHEAVKDCGSFAIRFPAGRPLWLTAVRTAPSCPSDLEIFLTGS
jgi:hypothetical protein